MFAGPAFALMFREPRTGAAQIAFDFAHAIRGSPLLTSASKVSRACTAHRPDSISAAHPRDADTGRRPSKGRKAVRDENSCPRTRRIPRVPTPRARAAHLSTTNTRPEARAPAPVHRAPPANAVAHARARGSRQHAPPVAAMVRISAQSAWPSPENPRHTSALSASVNRASPKSSTQALACCESSAYTAQGLAMAAASASTRSRDESVTRTARPRRAWSQTTRSAAGNPQRRLGWSRPSAACAEEAQRLHGRHFEAPAHARLVGLHFEHAAHPSRGQIDLALDDIRTVRAEAEFLRPTAKSRPASSARERAPHAWAR